jgi:hypothetical protein
LGFGVWGSGFRVFRVEGVGLRVEGLEFRVQGLGLRAWGLGKGFRVYGSWYGV